MAVIDFFDRGWRLNPNAIAFIQDEQSFTYREVGGLSCSIANKLLSLGLPKETKGAVWASNDVTAWTCTLGLWRANMTWIPVNARNSAAENEQMLNSFDCEVMFFSNSLPRCWPTCSLVCRVSAIGSALTRTCRKPRRWPTGAAVNRTRRLM